MATRTDPRKGFRWKNVGPSSELIRNFITSDSTPVIYATSKARISVFYTLMSWRFYFFSRSSSKQHRDFSTLVEVPIILCAHLFYFTIACLLVSDEHLHNILKQEKKVNATNNGQGLPAITRIFQLAKRICLEQNRYRI